MEIDSPYELEYKSRPLINEWEVAVACDINLGKVFRDKEGVGEQPAMVLEIDPHAVETTLQSFSQPSHAPRKVLVKACAHESLNHTRNQSADRESLGQASERGEDSYEAHVSVTRPLAKATEIALLEQENGATLQLISFARRVLKLQPISVVQETAIHELKHIGDFTDPEVVKQERRHYKKRSLIEYGKVGLFYTGIAYGTEEITKTMTEIPPQPTATIIGFGAAIAFYLVRRKKIGWKTYTTSPMEKRARETEESSPEMTAIMWINASKVFAPDSEGVWRPKSELT